MNWTELLKQQAAMGYSAAAGLTRKVDDSRLGWKPEIGTNWMTTAQLLLHMAASCGTSCRGFVTNEWRDDTLSADFNPEKDGFLPPADKYLAVANVAEALLKLEADRKLTIEMIDRASESALNDRHFAVPWGGPDTNLGSHILLAIDHLNMHKAQLFYYLKLQGVSVNTGDLYGI